MSNLRSRLAAELIELRTAAELQRQRKREEIAAAARERELARRAREAELQRQREAEHEAWLNSSECRMVHRWLGVPGAPEPSDAPKPRSKWAKVF